MKWTIDGVRREALVFLPSTFVRTKAPVVFAFHGHGGNMRFAARGMAFQDFWPAAIVIYMQGLPAPTLFPERDPTLRPGWQRDPGQLGDRDLKFFDAVLATLVNRGPSFILAENATGSFALKSRSRPSMRSAN